MGLIKKILIPGCVLFLYSCSSNPTFSRIPGGDLGGQGLLIMQFPSKNMHGGYVSFNDETTAGLDRETGFIAVLKPPGKYTARKISEGRYLGGNMNQTTWFEMNLSFEIHPGKITNLGALFPDTSKGKVRAHDNSPAVRRLIREQYPELYARLVPGSIVNHANIFGRPAVDALRKNLASRNARYIRDYKLVNYSREIQPLLGTDYFVGKAGLFGVMESGMPVILPNKGWEDLYPVPGFSRVPLVQGILEELYEVDTAGQRLVPVRKPVGFRYAQAFRFGERGIVLVKDKEIAIRLSGKSGWRLRDVNGMTFTHARAFEYLYSTYSFAENSTHFFIAQYDLALRNSLEWTNVLRVNKKDLSMDVLRLNAMTVKFLVTDQELVAFISYNPLIGTSRYTLRLGTDQGATHEIPLNQYSACDLFDLERNNKRALWAACRSIAANDFEKRDYFSAEYKAYFTSYDLGKTWIKDR